MLNDLSKTILVIGASSAIATAFVDYFLQQHPTSLIVRVSRNELQPKANTLDFVCDNQACSMANVVTRLVQEKRKIDQVFIFNGILHSDTIMPEKHLGAVNEDALHSVFHANAVIPILWLQQLKPLLNHSQLVCLFSARIGSIDDNHLGGWYSYRASKAALNMLAKSAFIELKRFHSKLSFLLYHPGTTDSILSKPFQKNVPPDKLFSPMQGAQYLFTVSQDALGTHKIQFLDWQGKTIPW